MQLFVIGFMFLRRSVYEKRTIIRVLSIIIVLSMLFVNNAFASNVIDTNINLTEIKHSWADRTSLLSKKDIPQQLIDNVNLDLAKVESVDIGDMESLDSFTVVNNDGTKTIYKFEKPIKYVNEDKKLQYIDNELVSSTKSNGFLSTYSYENKANSVKSYYSNSINKGILLENEDYSIRMTPVAQNNAIANKTTAIEQGIATDAVRYTDVFATGVDLEYISTNSGIKENIVIDEKMEIPEIKFTIITNNLTAECIDGTYIAFRGNNSDVIKYTISQPYIKDSSGVNPISLDNGYTLTQVKTNMYEVTMVLDEAFLEADSTVYPVIIDPMISIASDNFQDASVFSGTSTNYHSSQWNTVGYLSGKGIGLSYIKVTNTQDFIYVNPENVWEANYYAYEGSGTSTTMTVGVYDTNYYEWVSYATYSNLSNKLGALYNTYIINASDTSNYENNWYCFSIKELWKQWLKHSLGQASGKDQEYGFCLKDNAATSSTYKQFGSSENTVYNPYLEIVYTEDTPIESGYYYISNKYFEDSQEDIYYYLDVSDAYNNWDSEVLNVGVYSAHYNKNQQWFIESLGNGYYKFRSNWPFATNKYLTLLNGAIVVSDYSSTSAYQLFRIVKYSNNNHRIIPVGGNNLVNVLTADSMSLTVLNGWYNGEDNQKWNIYEGLRVDVQHRQQEKTNWCWAACAQMIGTKNVGNQMIDGYEEKTQTEIVNYVKFSLLAPNEPAVPNELKKAIKYVTPENETPYIYDVHSGAALTELNIKNYIINDIPIVIELAPYNDETDEYEAGHYLVIYGYQKKPNGLNFLIRDSSKDENVDTSTTYDQLIDKTFSHYRGWDWVITMYQAVS